MAGKGDITLKAIIKGKRYDTSTAEYIAGHSYSHPGDFNYCCEELYRKKTGEYFLAGEGGPMSKYRKSAGQNSWTGGEGITVLSFDEAREWVEQTQSADTYEEIFGPVAENDTTVLATFSIRADILARLRKECEKTGKTQKEIVTNALEAYLKD